MSKKETQSEALRLAEMLEKGPRRQGDARIAAVLRGLDAENKALREMLDEAPAACTALGGLGHEQALAATRAVREVLEKEHSVYLTNASILRIVQAVEGAAQAAAKNGCERTESDANGHGGIDRERMEKAMASETFTLPNGLSESEIVDHFTRAAKEQA